MASPLVPFLGPIDASWAECSIDFFSQLTKKRLAAQCYFHDEKQTVRVTEVFVNGETVSWDSLTEDLKNAIRTELKENGSYEASDFIVHFG